MLTKIYGNKLMGGGKSAHISASFSFPNPLLAGRRCISQKKDFVTITLIHGPSVPVDIAATL